MLERDSELVALAGAVDAGCDGVGALVLLQAAAGLGKSALLEAAAELGRAQAATVLRARGEELERSRPWALVRSLFAPVLGAPLQAPSLRQLSGAAAPAAALFARDGDPNAHPGFDDPLPLIHALFWLTADLATDVPVLLLIDDAQWGDEQSLRFVRYLLPRLADLPVAVVLARRTGEPGGERLELESIAADPRASVLELASLSAAAVAELVRDALGMDAAYELAELCAEVTGGNPFYLHELLLELRTGRAEGDRLSPAMVRGVTPKSVARTVFLRVSRLGVGAASLARAVAILGDGAQFPHAAELAGLDHADASASLDDLAAAEILAPGEPLRFVHPLVAHAIYADIGAGERGDLHLRAASLLDRDGAAPEDVASQLLRAGRRADPWVVDALRVAARHARAEGASAAAADYLARALEEPPSPERRRELLVELGRAEAVLGRPQAPARFRAALELVSDRVQRAELWLALGRALGVQGEHPAAAEAFDAGLSELDEHATDLGRELRAARWMATSLQVAHTTRVGVAPEPELEFDGTRTPTPGQRQLLAQLGMQRAFEGRPRDELAELAERAWGDGALLEAETSDGLTWSLVTATLLIADELERDVEVCDAVLADARRRGSPMAFATVSYCRSWPLLLQGRIDGAVADAQAAVDAREDGWSSYIGSAAACLALGQLERGLPEEARAALALVENDPVIQASLEYVLVLGAAGAMLLADGQPDDALKQLLRIGEIGDAAGFDTSSVFPWRARAAIAASVAGDRDLGRRLAREALAAAHRTGAPSAVAAAQRACGHAERGDAAIEHFGAAARTLEGGPPRLEYAYTLVDLGAALRRSHRRAAAREPLHRGLALASAAGAHALSERARTELDAAGSRSTAHTRGGVESLTPSERRVAELAAAGHSNRAIAQSLFVTVKAVEYHLGNTYRKLDIKQRGELAPQLK